MAKSRRQPPRTDLQSWLHAMGYHFRQFDAAGAHIGLNASQMTSRSMRKIELSKAELMAMSAAWLDIPPWQSGLATLTDDQRVEINRQAAALRAAIARAMAPMPTELQPPPGAADPPASQVLPS
jgi:hypothetical protein